MSSFARRKAWLSLVLLGFVFGSSLLHADDGLPASLDPLSGGGQIGVIGEAFPVPLRARVTDSAGQPLSGVAVNFNVDQCVSIDEASSPCPPQTAYPSFEGDSPMSVSVMTDADGQAIAPTLMTGQAEGPFQVYATVWDVRPGAGILGEAYFPLRQTLSLDDAAAITPAFTGAWYDPAQSGHGILVEVLPDDRLLAYWFTFTPDGSQQAWFGGVGTIVGGRQAIVYADRGQGGQWIPAFDPSRFSLERWGTLTFTFSGCNRGHVDFFGYGPSSPWGSGSMELTRLTEPAGLACE
ncbi:MAG TPA: hypothetical protein VHE32_02060 [Rhodanobacteraceae bacterium]|nr:hypothetical protein [Rhodanobacteraceae bacterium]